MSFERIVTYHPYGVDAIPQNYTRHIPNYPNPYNSNLNSRPHYYSSQPRSTGYLDRTPQPVQPEVARISPPVNVTIRSADNSVLLNSSWLPSLGENNGMLRGRITSQAVYRPHVERSGPSGNIINSMNNMSLQSSPDMFLDTTQTQNYPEATVNYQHPLYQRDVLRNQSEGSQHSVRDDLWQRPASSVRSETPTDVWAPFIHPRTGEQFDSFMQYVHRKTHVQRNTPPGYTSRAMVSTRDVSLPENREGSASSQSSQEMEILESYSGSARQIAYENQSMASSQYNRSNPSMQSSSTRASSSALGHARLQDESAMDICRNRSIGHCDSVGPLWAVARQDGAEALGNSPPRCPNSALIEDRHSYPLPSVGAGRVISAGSATGPLVSNRGLVTTGDFVFQNSSCVTGSTNLPVAVCESGNPNLQRTNNNSDEVNRNVLSLRDSDLSAGVTNISAGSANTQAFRFCNQEPITAGSIGVPTVYQGSNCGIGNTDLPQLWRCCSVNPQRCLFAR